MPEKGIFQGGTGLSPVLKNRAFPRTKKQKKETASP
jgi:hypothetical protein